MERNSNNTAKLICVSGATLALVGCLPEGVGSDLDGTWKGPCEEVSGEYRQIQTEYSRGDISEDFVVFEDSNCITELSRDFSYSGSYVIGDAITTSTGLEAFEIDFTSAGSTTYDIYRISGGSLFFSSAASDLASERPDSLDLDYGYTK